MCAGMERSAAAHPVCGRVLGTASGANFRHRRLQAAQAAAAYNAGAGAALTRYCRRLALAGEPLEAGDLDYAAVALLALICSLLECLVGKEGLLNDSIPDFALLAALQVRREGLGV